jgi:aspartyl-tRNA(Asn)/glutamyl-tRNA(Gln) amidotransferase subunit A
MSDAPFYHLTIQEASRLIQSRDLSPVELTQAFLDRIDVLNGRMKAYVTLLADSAMEDARQAEAEIAAGNYKGPLHGIPVAYKDLFDTRGVRTTASSKVMEHRVPDEDAVVVARLRDAGSILLGKLAMSEFAAGGPPTSLFEGSANPWDVERSPGGSSSGSGTAIAAGLAMGTLGSDTGGSIRGPASFCGIVGLKPSYGLLSRSGVVPLSWSLDNAGPMTWTVEDAALMLQVMAGYDPKDNTTSRAPVPDYSESLRQGVSGITIGVPRHLYQDPESGVVPHVAAAVDRAVAELEQMGAKVVEVNLPVFRLAWVANTALLLTEGFAYHRDNLRSQPHNFGDMVRAVLYMGGLTSGTDYVQAQRARSKMLREVGEVMRSVDVLITPTSNDVAPKIGKEIDPVTMVMGLLGEASERSVNWTAPFNLLGAPAISVPCGFSNEGLPMGLQIAGRRLDEPTVLRVAYAYQQTAGWHHRRPAV